MGIFWQKGEPPRETLGRTSVVTGAVSRGESLIHEGERVQRFPTPDPARALNDDGNMFIVAGSQSQLPRATEVELADKARLSEMAEQLEKVQAAVYESLGLEVPPQNGSIEGRLLELQNDLNLQEYGTGYAKYEGKSEYVRTISDNITDMRVRVTEGLYDTSVSVSLKIDGTFYSIPLAKLKGEVDVGKVTEAVTAQLKQSFGLVDEVASHTLITTQKGVAHEKYIHVDGLEELLRNPIGQRVVTGAEAVADAGLSLSRLLEKAGKALRVVGTIAPGVGLALAADDAHAKKAVAEELAAEGRLSAEGLAAYTSLANKLTAAELDPTLGAASGVAIDEELAQILAKEPALTAQEKASLGLETTTALVKQLLGTQAVGLETQMLVNFVASMPEDFSSGHPPQALLELAQARDAIEAAEAAERIERGRIPRDNAAVDRAEKAVYAAEEAFLDRYADLTADEFTASVAYMQEVAGVTPEMLAILEDPKTRNPLLQKLAQDGAMQAVATIQIAELGEAMIAAAEEPELAPDVEPDAAPEGPARQEDLIARRDPVSTPGLG